MGGGFPLLSANRSNGCHIRRCPIPAIPVAIRRGGSNYDRSYRIRDRWLTDDRLLIVGLGPILQSSFAVAFPLIVGCVRRRSTAPTVRCATRKRPCSASSQWGADWAAWFSLTGVTCAGEIFVHSGIHCHGLVPPGGISADSMACAQDGSTRQVA